MKSSLRMMDQKIEQLKLHFKKQSNWILIWLWFNIPKIEERAEL